MVSGGFGLLFYVYYALFNQEVGSLPLICGAVAVVALLARLVLI